MKKIKIYIKIMLVLLVCIIGFGNVGVFATLQSNPNTQYNKTNTAPNWITEIRRMEETGGAMGLNEELGADYTSSSESNNIDMHMMKSTEYGAIAILSASGYGNPSNDRAITSTTGNDTGVILNTNYWEFVAGKDSKSGSFGNINKKYYIIHSGYYKGDALGGANDTFPGCKGWHSASYSYWVNSNYPYLARGKNGIFSYGYDYYHTNTSNGGYSRGVVVCGTGV